MFNTVDDDDYTYIDIVSDKYIHMSDGVLKGLCSKYKIEIYWGETQEKMALTLIPEALCNDGFLKKFYFRLPAKEKMILKFIVNYNGNDIERDVKKKFLFEIALMKKRTVITYVWWLELFMDNNQFDSTLKEYFLDFLSENRQRKSKKTGQIEKKVNLTADFVQTATDIKTVTVNKFSISGKLHPQTLEDAKPKDAILAIHIIYSLSNDSKLKITQKGMLTVRVEKLLKERMPTGFDYIWLINFLSTQGYLNFAKNITISSKFIKLVANSDADIIKAMFNDFVNAKEMYELRYAMFRVSRTNGKYVKLMRDMILNIIKKEPTALWINIDYIVDKIKIDSKTLQYITNDYRYCYGFFGNSNRISYNKIEHLKVVVRYFVKIFMGLMNGFGLCNLGITKYQTFNKQDIRIIVDEEQATYASVEFFKLSDLGSYVLGLESEFKSKDDYKLILNPYILEIKVQNRSNLSDIFLEKFATRVDDSKYKTDIKIFTNNITSLLEYENVKKALIQKCDEIPQNWKVFFKILKERSSGAIIVSQSAVLIKLQNNKELLKLISTDKKLKTKILKADNFHIVVLKSDLAYVKKTVKEYGVLI